MKRREFITRGGIGLTAAIFPYSGLTNLLGAPQASGPQVWELQGNATTMINTLFEEMGGLESLTAKDLTKTVVLIKPNFCLPYAAEMGITSSPAVLQALCEYLADRGVNKIILADHTLKGRAEEFQKSGLVRATQNIAPCRWIFANEEHYFEPVSVNGKVLKETAILKLLKRADILINFPTAKHHSATQVSLAVKNLMGFIWDRTSFHTQLDLHQAIGDLALAIKPSIHIVDATRILLNGGPTGPGTVIQENKIFASLDPVSVDSILVSRYDFGGRQLSAKEIPHLVAAYQNGIGEIDLSKIKLKKMSS